VRLVFRPLAQWPGERTRARQGHRFIATWSETLGVLEREVSHLARRPNDAEVVLQVDAPESAMRLDGGIKANATVGEPGVVVSFESKHGPLRYATDTFTSATVQGHHMPGWQANVRAIALGLEALRKVDRYGISKDGEQYRGWSQLPPGRPTGPAMTVEEAAQLLAVEGLEDPRAWVDVMEGGPDAAFRMAAKRHHPDAGGNPDTFRRITTARDLLAAHR